MTDHLHIICTDVLLASLAGFAPVSATHRYGRGYPYTDEQIRLIVKHARTNQPARKDLAASLGISVKTLTTFVHEVRYNKTARYWRPHL